MPKRNIVWITIAAVIAVLLWRFPQTILLRDALYHKFGSLLEVRQLVLKNYVENVDDDVLLRGAIDGMVHRLDPFSAYYSADEYTDFRSMTEGQFQGIGIEVGRSRTGEMFIISPIEGSPAFQAGLRSGDLIIEINGAKTADMTLKQAVQQIKGPTGTSVTLLVQRPPLEEHFELAITRARVTVRSVRGYARTADWEWDYMIDPEEHIGYLRISAFERATTQQLDEVIRDLRSQHMMRALILDVRDNGGGFMDVVVDMANLFLSEGMIVSTRGRTTTAKPYLATPENTYPAFPLVILVNHGSASASEILAGALQDHRRAVIIGEKTFGKGSVQEVFEVPSQNGSAGQLKLTTSHYVLPKGELIHGRGVTPDLTVKMTPKQRSDWIDSIRAVYAPSAPTTQPTTTSAPERVAIMIDPQLQAALETLRKELATQPHPN